jgi:hypothetical protein
MPESKGCSHVTIVATPGSTPCPAIISSTGTVMAHQLIITIDTVRKATITTTGATAGEDVCLNTYVATWNVNFFHYTDKSSLHRCHPIDAEHLTFSPWLHDLPMADRIGIRMAIENTVAAAYERQSSTSAWILVDGAHPTPRPA